MDVYVIFTRIEKDLQTKCRLYRDLKKDKEEDRKTSGGVFRLGKSQRKDP